MSISNEFNIQQFTNDKWSCWSNKQSRFFFRNSRRITNGTTWIAISFSITIPSPLTKQRIKSTRNPPGESILLVQNNGVGDSDVGDFMMVTGLRFWWQNHYVGDFFRYVGDFLNVLNWSPTSQTCHQHIWSPTSVTNIDVTTEFLGLKYF